MACSVPIYYLLHRRSAAGETGFLMEPDLPTALADAAQGEAEGWTALSITLGRETVLEGEALRAAIAAMQAPVGA
jgi:hypothetical protein